MIQFFLKILCDLVICAQPYQCEVVALYYLCVAEGEKYTVGILSNWVYWKVSLPVAGG